MAKPATVKIKLVSTEGTGFYYVTKKNISGRNIYSPTVTPCRPIPAKVIVDALDRLNDDLSSRFDEGDALSSGSGASNHSNGSGSHGSGGVGVDFNQVLGSEWNNSAHYPSKINAELESISKW